MSDEPKKQSGGKSAGLANLRRGGPGRHKGVPNKTTTQLKEAILEAASKAGGEEGLVGYLTVQASDNPSSFMPLLGKVLPMTLAGDDKNPIQLKVIRQIVGGI